MKDINLHYILGLRQHIEYVKCDMDLDITYVCDHAGKRDRYYDNFYKEHSYIPLTLTRARKIFRLVKKYADDETVTREAILSCFEQIEELKNNYFYNLGDSGRAAAEYIVERLSRFSIAAQSSTES